MKNFFLYFCFYHVLLNVSCYPDLIQCPEAHFYLHYTVRRFVKLRFENDVKIYKNHKKIKNIEKKVLMENVPNTLLCRSCDITLVSRFYVPISAIFVEDTKSSSKMRKIETRGAFSKKILKNINAMQVMYVISFTTPFKNPENSSGKF